MTLFEGCDLGTFTRMTSPTLDTPAAAAPRPSSIRPSGTCPRREIREADDATTARFWNPVGALAPARVHHASRNAVPDRGPGPDPAADPSYYGVLAERSGAEPPFDDL